MTPPASELCRYCRRKIPRQGCEYLSPDGVCMVEYERNDRAHRQRHDQRIPDPDQPKRGLWF